MRDDPRVAITIACATAFALLANALWAFWPGADDRAWEEAWSALDDLDRAWLGAASRSSVNRATLEERGELDLAKGFGRRVARRRGRIAMVLLLPLIGIAVLIATGLMGASVAFIFLSTPSFVLGIFGIRRDRQIKARYREVQANYLATGGAAS
jgi:hypothetical protein